MCYAYCMNSNLLSVNRLEAFSDGVLAIIITIMVIEIHAPDGSTIYDLFPLIPTILSYILSFIYIAIYWNNHHHLLKSAKCLNARIMWANMSILFWLSLVPFATAWLGKYHSNIAPNILYGTVLLLAAVSYFILQRAIAQNLGPNSAFSKAIGKDVKGKVSLIVYIASIASAFIHTGIAQVLFVLVAILWIIPDKRLEAIEKQL